PHRHGLRIGEEGAEAIPVPLLPGGRLMGVDSQGAPDVRMAMTEGEDLLGLIQPDRRHQEAADAALAGGVQGPLPLVRRQALQMAVGVDENAHRFYRTRVPLGTATAGCSSTGLPSSEAARTMPFDSTPMSLAGWRVATTTTCLPTSSSG